ARGRVYSGDAALRVGLVDRLGGMASALIRARQLAQLGPDAGIEVRPVRPSRLIDYVLGPPSDADASGPALPVGLSPQLRALVRAALALEQLGDGTPLARLPFEIQL